MVVSTSGSLSSSSVRILSPMIRITSAGVSHVAVNVAAKPGHTGDRIRKIKPLVHRLVKAFRRHPMLDREDELAQFRTGDRRCVDAS